MSFIIETRRCCLRPLLPDDAAEMFALNMDPEVMRYTGDPAFENEAAARIFLENYDPYSRSNMGRWAVIQKSDHQWLGWCGLKLHEEEEVVDLGYRFHRKYWGKGYATETGLACIEYGFQQLQLNRIIGQAERDNKASIRVLEKCGMHYENDFQKDGKDHVLYAIYQHNGIGTNA